MRGYALIVDDQPAFRRLLVRVLEGDGWEVAAASNGIEALEQVRARSRAGRPFNLLISDVRMPRLDGLGLLDRVLAEEPGLPVVLVTAHGSVPDAVEAMRRGAFDYVLKPLDSPEQVVALARRAREVASPTAPPGADQAPQEMVSASEAMERVHAAITQIAPTAATVLITGESGTGKELVARRLHALSPRSGGPFVAVNCAAIPEGLLDSELFGHERGAFTGADRSRHGRFEAADGGTLFLDEVGEMSAGLQARLLRVLQERCFERVGGTETRHVDVRLVAATHRDLPALIAEGSFREDLYYRLHVVPIHLPPLRARGQDVLLLAQHFLEALARRHGRVEARLSPLARERLVDHPWPGNVRELWNVMERATILCGPATEAGAAEPTAIEPEHLGLDGGSDEVRAAPVDLKSIEREAIRRALGRTGGNRREAAGLLGIALRTLQYKIKEYGLR